MISSYRSILCSEKFNDDCARLLSINNSSIDPFIENKRDSVGERSSRKQKRDKERKTLDLTDGQNGRSE